MIFTRQATSVDNINKSHEDMIFGERATLGIYESSLYVFKSQR